MKTTKVIQILERNRAVETLIKEAHINRG